MWLQILEYCLDLWKKDRAAKRPLTPVIPLVFYHGKRRWNIPEEFQEQFCAPTSALPSLPRFRHILFDTADWKEEKTPELHCNIFLLSGLMLLKHAREGELAFPLRASA